MQELAFIDEDKYKEPVAYVYMLIMNFLSAVIMLNLFLMVILQFRKQKHLMDMKRQEPLLEKTVQEQRLILQEWMEFLFLQVIQREQPEKQLKVYIRRLTHLL